MAHTDSKAAISRLFEIDPHLARGVKRKMEKRRACNRNHDAVAAITSVNDGYFILPLDIDEVSVPDEDGPRQLRLDFGDDA